MIAESKKTQALGALNWVLVQLRTLAVRDTPGRELAELLDLAEYLPRLMADPEDRTIEFRDVLLDFVRRREDFRLALDRFEAAADRPW